MDRNDRYSRELEELQQELASIEEDAAPIVGYRRPQTEKGKKKKKKYLGAVSLLFALISWLGLAGVAIYGVVSLLESSLSPAILSIAKFALLICGILAIVALLMGTVALILRHQKKGAAIAAVVLALLVLVLAVFCVYAYDYVFGEMEHDAAFQTIPEADLNVAEVSDEGAILRNTKTPKITITAAEIEERNQGRPIEWEELSDDELPDHVRELIHAPTPEEPSYLLDGAEEIKNFVLYGIDNNGSSDSIIILSVDRVHKKIKLISLARDSYVVIPEWGTHAKMTYAYTWGGPQMAVGTLNYNFTMNIADYIAVDINQLEDIIDLVGGVEVELDAAEVRYLQGKQSGLHTGLCTLYGRAGVLYARTRSSDINDNEIKRTSRQREVLMAIMYSLRDMPVSNYPAFIRNCLAMCTTSFNANELLEIALEVVQNDYTIESYALLEEIPYWGGRLGSEGHFYCVYDLNKASDKIYRLIYEDLYVSAYPDEEEVPEP